MKTIIDAKRRMTPGTRMLCVENTMHPELNGTQRTVIEMGSRTWSFRHQDGRVFRSQLPAGIKIIDANTMRIPLGKEHHLTLRFLVES